MDDIKFTDPHLDKHDNKTLHITDPHYHHLHHQPDRELQLSLRHPMFKYDFDWDPSDRTPFEMEGGDLRPWTSRFHDWKVAIKKATGESCNAPSSGKAIEEEEETTDDDDDNEMDAFYDSVDVAGIPMLSNSHEKLVTTTPSHEEIRRVLRDVQELFLSRDASILLESEVCSFLKANLDYLSKLCADHGSISTETSKLLILEASQLLTRWSREYTKAHTKIDYIMSQLQRAGELEMSLKSNKKRFLEVVASRKRKREIFEEGKTIKAELDEFKKNVPQWEYEHTLAKKTQANIIAEWSRLQETFQNIEKDWNL